MKQPKNRSLCKNPILEHLRSGDYIFWKEKDNKIGELEGRFWHMAKGGHLVVKPQSRHYAVYPQNLKKHIFNFDHRKVRPTDVLRARRVTDTHVYHIDQYGVSKIPRQQ